jgi:hypothetical protein
MKYFQLRDDMGIPNRWYLGEIVSEDGTEPRLRAGIPFSEGGMLRSSVHHGERVLDFCLTSFAVPVARRHIADAIGAVAGSDLQSIPLSIPGTAGMMVLNATRVVRCLDESRSEFIKWTIQDHRSDLAGQYRQVTKLVVEPKSIPDNAHFFRIEGWLIALVLSEAVKSALTEAGCLGGQFVEVSP